MFFMFHIDDVKFESIPKRFGRFFEELHFRHKTSPRGSSVQFLVVARAGVGKNVFLCVFIDCVKSELILSKFGGFLEKLHSRHKTPRRGPSVQLLVVANLLTWAIIC